MTARALDARGRTWSCTTASAPGAARGAPAGRPAALRRQARRGPRISQEEINALLIEHARRATGGAAEGRRPVHLRPRRRGGARRSPPPACAFEVVPGVTRRRRAGLRRHPGDPSRHSAAFTFVTGHEDPDQGRSTPTGTALARVPGTIVVLMGMRRLAAIAEALMAGGRARREPAAAVQWGTTARQRTSPPPSATIAERARSGGPARRPSRGRPRGRARDEIGWLERRPLLTGASSSHGPAPRPATCPTGCARWARGRGAADDPHRASFPTGPGWRSARAGAYALVSLTSLNGVARCSRRWPPGARRSGARRRAVAAIGPGRGRARRARHPGRRRSRRFDGRGVLEALADGRRWGCAHWSRARRRLAAGCSTGAARARRRVDVLELYETVAEPLDATLEAASRPTT